MSDSTNKELLDALGVEVPAETNSSLTPRQERIIAGFEDIQRFVEEPVQSEVGKAWIQAQLKDKKRTE